ncbi:DUF4145 [Desulfonema limicola]|uniref:DUF4145 n=1 Tax=Desulfonema limicola TaxID=45656 RepID=A0A975B977_9BACT|nr:DUF4145 domain-containing protein [Desulfonema limicola]QTA81084.1 DUF4145 [Desulfonema limicola]
MNLSDVIFVTFEVIPIERLGFENQNEVMKVLTDNLFNIGYKECYKTNLIRIYQIDDYKKLRKIVENIFQDDEYVWLSVEYFESIIIAVGEDNVLCGMFSSKSLKIKSPYNRDAKYISSLIGDYVYAPAIARTIVAKAIELSGQQSLSDKIDCKYNFSIETALAGDILFIEPPLEYDLRIKCENTGNEWQPLDIISSNYLLSQDIVKLVRDESLLDEIVIGKAMPFHVFSDVKSFSLFNHFSIKAVKNKFVEIISEILHFSIHLNWKHSSDYFSKNTDNTEAFHFALKQKNRLTVIEKRERKITQSLQLLERRYPNKTYLYELETNNIYANIVRYSPVFLNWKTHLETYISKQEIKTPKFVELVSSLDWKSLEKTNIADMQDANKIITLLDIDPGSTLTRIRVIIEKMIKYVFSQKVGKANKKLADMLVELNKRKVFPPIIYIYLNTLRLTGNIAAHKGEGSKEEVEAVIPVFIRVVEWFIDREI